MNFDLEQTAQIAEELAFSLRELNQLIKEDNKDQLHCGLHMISVYEKLMVSFETPLHPAYRKNLEQFRKESIPLLKVD